MQRLRHQLMQFASRNTTMTECHNLEDDILGLEASSAKLDLAADVSTFSPTLAVHSKNQRRQTLLSFNIHFSMLIPPAIILIAYHACYYAPQFCCF